MESVLDVERCAGWLGFKTKAALQSFQEQCARWSSEPRELMHLRETFQRWKATMERHPTLCATLDTHFAELAELEAKMTPLLYQESKLEEESYSEILFFRPLLQPLNFIPCMLGIWSALRVYILPGLSLLLPIMTLLAPYLIIRFVFHLPMNMNHYLNLMHAMISGNVQAMMEPHAELSAPPAGALFKQVGMAILTFIQGIVQPYWTHQHLHSIDTIVQEQGESILRFHALYESMHTLLSSYGFTMFRSPLPSLPTPREAVARLLLEPTYFKLAFRYLGALEVMYRLSHQPEIHPVQWIASPSPVFRIRDTFDFQVPFEKRTTLSASLEKDARHALLTGPNKGGKSTVLRSLSISALLAHTYGCALGHLTATPFHKLMVCLKPDDLPGSKSRFEREIEFTASTLAPTAPVLIFIDELYHSTNPPDALRSCTIYCEQLWKKKNVVSVISTHLFEWVERAPASVQRLCCPATLPPHGDIQFHYTLQPGVCTVSSVDSLLEKNGLTIPRPISS